MNLIMRRWFFSYVSETNRHGYDILEFKSEELLSMEDIVKVVDEISNECGEKIYLVNFIQIKF